MKRSVKATLYASAAVIAIFAGIVLIKYATIYLLDRQVRKAWAPLEQVLETRYTNVPRLVKGLTEFKGAEDEQSRALTEAYKEFAAAGSIPDKVRAGKHIEMLLRDFFMHQQEQLPEILSNYDFLIARRQFQVTRQLIKPPLNEFDAAVTRFNIYTDIFPNSIIARKMGIRHEGYYFNPDGTTR
ncbi:MAG: LemA family protein [bacterium]